MKSETTKNLEIIQEVLNADLEIEEPWRLAGIHLKPGESATISLRVRLTGRQTGE